MPWAFAGQGRGNSGVLLQGVGEVQILNSYGLDGYWDECGSLYKRHPAKVNAAAPPLQWQTWDIDLRLPKYDPVSGEKQSESHVTVRLNGYIIHNDTELPSGARDAITIGLQDHINAIQFRNIWIDETAE